MNEKNPALIAARNSWSCVHGKRRDDWLALMADDVVIEDPIGKSPLDPAGKGHQGRTAAERFWDQNIGPNSIKIEALESYTAGENEAAHLMSLTTTMKGGMAVRVRGIFTYRTNVEGKIANLRGFWEMADIEMAS